MAQDNTNTFEIPAGNLARLQDVIARLLTDDEPDLEPAAPKKRRARKAVAP